ncbi:hypothetical protein HAZT_HAZT006294 [Hyalella azteca]|uniref:MoaB/Mog domain-containing protein n=1 Tax=Hyalella azteca TaxID=294128 RepID=A0A6A0HEG6_HYAAZ|nr:hypothetical protein HAZT_HAZT006294 [Hyalella azteca]
MFVDDRITVGILTISDRCSSGEATDFSGQNLAQLIEEGIIPNAKLAASGCVADDQRNIIEALEHWCDHLRLNLILTTGGTGVAPRDVTPEAVRAVIQKEVTGLSFLMTSSSLKSTQFAALSRPVCGIRDTSLIVTLPGSQKGSEECLRFVASVLPHALDLISNRTSKLNTTHQALQSTPVVKLENDAADFGSCEQQPLKHHHRAHDHHDCSASKAQVEDICSRPRKSPYKMITVDQAQEIIFKMASTKNPVNLPLNQAHGFVLSEDVVSKYPLPPFPASVKDGYAVIAADGAGVRRVVSAVAAGDHAELGTDAVLARGDCIRINTGAPVEDTELLKSSEDGGVELEVKILKAPKEGQDIRPLGCDIALGELVLPKGTYLGPAEIGLAASVGLANVMVFPKPLVGVLSTGNEVQAADGRPLARGCIFDSNSPTLVSLLRLHHYNCITCHSAKDTPDDLKNSISSMLDQDVDILVTSGGVSMGDKDILRPVLQADFDATIHFAQVLMKPGKPTTFASMSYKGRRRLVLGLPGNPVSATVTANLYLIPLCRAISGRADFMYTQLKVKLEHSISLDHRPEYHRAVLSFSPSCDLPLARSTGSQLSSRLLSMANARVLLVLPPRSPVQPSLQAGEIVTAILL